MDGDLALDPWDRYVLSLSKSVTVEWNPESRIENRGGEAFAGVTDRPPVVRFRVADRQLTLDPVTAGMLDALRLLEATGATRPWLAALVTKTDGASFVPQLNDVLGSLGAVGGLRATVVVEDRPLVTLEPTAPALRFVPTPPVEGARYVLSRFAFGRRHDDHLVLESPLVAARVILHDSRAAALLLALAQPVDAAGLAERADLASDDVTRVLGLLASANLIAEVYPSGVSAEEADPTLATWEFHDLLFHARSRPGRSDGLFGTALHRAGALPPLPAVKPVWPDPGQDAVIPLFQPDLETVIRDDPPFTQVLETRASIRAYSERPLGNRELGEFLYRVARIRRIDPAEPGDPASYERTSRPYPSAGACYPLELYLTINQCQDVSPGLYHYDPQGHHLLRIADSSSLTRRLLRNASGAAGLSSEPPVLIAITARFGRVGWKYRGFAYALILKDLGALFQSMYLVAAAMDLAPCALGAGDSDLLADLIGSDFIAESAVGEFLLGASPMVGDLPKD